jgi:hypothetical protein
MEPAMSSPSTSDLAEMSRNAVSTEALTDTVSALCAMGEKVAGSDEEALACAHIVEKLKSYGYEPVVHTFLSYVSHPVSTRLMIHGSETYELPAVGVAFGTSTPQGGLKGAIIACGAGTDSDFAGKDVAGKIALISKLPSPNNALAARKAGAIGLICCSAGHQRHKMIITPVWGTPEFDQVQSIPRISVASISAVDAIRIHADLAKGRVEATLHCDVAEGWRTLRLPVAELKGRESPFALVGAHYCSWFDGSTDNVTGDACVLELARVMKQHEGKLRHGVRFCWWPGHSHGRYSGSTWYADTFWHELHENAIVYFNIDSPGVRGATVYVPRHQMAEVSTYNERMTTEVTGWTIVSSAKAQLALGKRGDKYVSATRPSRAADQSFWGVGVSSMSVYSMLTPEDPDRDPNVGGSGGAWWWHSEHETIDKFDANILAQDTRLYASILLGLATLDVLPFETAAIAQDYLDSLREYDEVAGDVLPIRALIAEVEALKTALHAFDLAARTRTSATETRATNATILKVARVLNPVLYQATTPFAHDPALGSRALPAHSPIMSLKTHARDSDAFRFAEVGLLRRLNQVRHQVREAMRLVRG